MSGPGAGWAVLSRAGEPSAGSRTCFTRSIRTCLPVWYAFRDARAVRRAVQWLADNSLIGDAAAGHFLAGHPDPGLP